MKSFSVFIVLFCIIIFNCNSQVGEGCELDSLYNLMKNKDIYMAEKEQRITELKRMLNTLELTSTQSYDINLKLYNEYKTYMSDSAICYARKNLNIAEKWQNTVWIDESKLDLASLYVIAGMYIESVDILKSINKSKLPDWLLIRYYNCYKQLYNFYSYNNHYTQIYAPQSKLYRDSLLNILSNNTSL